MELKNILITEEKTILEAMEQLNTTAKKILFIHDSGKLLASISDGDIRRWLLSNGKLEDSVRSAANYNPLYLSVEEQYMATDFMKKHLIEAVPIVDKQLQIKNVLFYGSREKAADKGKLKIPVVIMAGGKGSRLYPYTKILPKPLIPVLDVPIFEHIIQQFQEFGCDCFYMIVNHKKELIKAYYNECSEKRYNLKFIEEELPLGTGGGLSLLKGKITETFILTNCDILIHSDFEDIIEMHKSNGNVITMICSLKNISIPYGVVELGAHGRIEEIKEKPQISFFTNTGCYIVEPCVIDNMQDNEEINFPDIINRYKEKGARVGAYPISEGAWYDMGNPEELKRMEKMLSTEIESNFSYSN